MINFDLPITPKYDVIFGLYHSRPKSIGLARRKKGFLAMNIYHKCRLVSEAFKLLYLEVCAVKRSIYSTSRHKSEGTF